MDFEILKKRVLPFFIEYYGEEYQAIIEERLSKVVPLFYTSNKGDEFGYWYRYEYGNFWN